MILTAIAHRILLAGVLSILYKRTFHHQLSGVKLRRRINRRYYQIKA